MKPRQIILVLALAWGLSACGGAPASTGASESGIAPAAPAPPAPAAEAPGRTSFDSSGTGGNAPVAGAPNQAQQFDRLVIKTADISLQVESVREAEAAVRAKVQALG